MDKKPKTKEVVRTIKEHTASVAKDKATAVGFKTKETVKNKVEEEFSPQQNRKQEQSPESYASDQVTESAERTVEDTVILGNRAVKTTVNKVKDKRTQKKEADKQLAETPDSDMPDNPSGQESELPGSTNPNAEGPQSSTETQTTRKPDNSPQKRNQDRNVPNTKSKDTNVQETGKQRRQETEKTTRTTKSEKSESVPNNDSSKTTSQKPKLKAQEPRNPDVESANYPKNKVSTPIEKKGKSEVRTASQSKKKQDIHSEAENIVIRRKTPEQTAIKERPLSEPKKAFKLGTEAPEREIKPRVKKQTPPKTRGQQTIKKAGTRNHEIRGIISTPHKAKEVQRGTQKSIKKADKSFKNAERTAKATKKAAETTAKAAKRSEEAARRTVKAAAKATKAAIKAVIEGIKAAIAAGKELISAIAAGGPVVLVIIIVICLIAAIGGTCFGIFLSNDETTGTQITMTEAITQLTAEHYTKLTETKANYTYDSMEIDGAVGGMTINWKDVLAIYAVKTTTSTEDAYEVVTMDDVKMDLLRSVLEDMNQMNCVVEQREVTETVTEKDSNGNDVTTTKTVTKNILKVTIKRLSLDEIIAQYNFNEEQKRQLTELMGPDYDELWDGIIGSSGDVLITNSTHVPIGIFTWPLQENWSITSSYGYRHDPDTGEWKFHGGTDIAAPTGTPILAAADGTVVISDYMAGGYGYYVKIQHNDTYATLYGHCSVLYVTAGQQVKQGQIIADVGQTGYATGPHVHFEVYLYGTRVNAMNYFK